MYGVDVADHQSDEADETGKNRTDTRVYLATAEHELTKASEPDPSWTAIGEDTAAWIEPKKPTRRNNNVGSLATTPRRRQDRSNVYVTKREEEDERETTFKPRISKKSNMLASKKRSKAHKRRAESSTSAGKQQGRNDSSLYDRLVQADMRWRHEVQQADAILRELDYETGQRMFTPHTGRGPLERDKSHKNAFERLHSIARQQQQQQQQLPSGNNEKRFLDIKRSSSSPLSPSSPQATQAAVDMRKKRLRQIFNVLYLRQLHKPEAQGNATNGRALNLQDVDMHGLRDDLRQDVMDAAKAMGANEVSCDEFVRLMEGVLSIYQRGPRPYLHTSVPLLQKQKNTMDISASTSRSMSSVSVPSSPRTHRSGAVTKPKGTRAGRTSCSANDLLAHGADAGHDLDQVRMLQSLGQLDLDEVIPTKIPDAPSKNAFPMADCQHPEEQTTQLQPAVSNA